MPKAKIELFRGNWGIFLKFSNFNIWPWKFLIKVMTKNGPKLNYLIYRSGWPILPKTKEIYEKLSGSCRVNKKVCGRWRWHRRTNRYKNRNTTPGNASVTSHSRAPYGLFPGFPGCFGQKSYVHSRGPHGPRAAPYEFSLPVRGP